MVLLGWGLVILNALAEQHHSSSSKLYSALPIVPQVPGAPPATGPAALKPSSSPLPFPIDPSPADDLCWPETAKERRELTETHRECQDLRLGRLGVPRPARICGSADFVSPRPARITDQVDYGPLNPARAARVDLVSSRPASGSG
ncbi:hypothetical protein L3X38_036289 [Prunus dulcis]|uniref:Uncharacterized protein n=1 Tax=Prunus dulcis TaxID=3755 RepID=A0AAD4YNF2_PRUDU|nr:hypothetical protein L3X38_036289 [Prunus dulcis]